MIFDSGDREGLKLSVHGALGLLALTCLGYNAIAFCRRGEQHLAVNAVLYAALVALEVRKVQHHAQ